MTRAMPANPIGLRFMGVSKGFPKAFILAIAPPRAEAVFFRGHHSRISGAIHLPLWRRTGPKQTPSVIPPQSCTTGPRVSGTSTRIADIDPRSEPLHTGRDWKGGSDVDCIRRNHGGAW